MQCQCVKTNPVSECNSTGFITIYTVFEARNIGIGMLGVYGVADCNSANRGFSSLHRCFAKLKIFLPSPKLFVQPSTDKL